MTYDVAALFIDPQGPYPRMAGVDCWDEARDARKYDGNLPVVAHPPCGRWCGLARLNELRWGTMVGDDGGCFESALASLRRCGGVLEHPAFSLAWSKYGLRAPAGRGWTRELGSNEWVCEVWQSAYGHKSQKRTWLLYVGLTPPPVPSWSRTRGTHQIGGGIHTGNNRLPKLGKLESIHSPPAFSEYLVSMARNSKTKPGPA